MNCTRERLVVVLGLTVSDRDRDRCAKRSLVRAGSAAASSRQSAAGARADRGGRAGTDRAGEGQSPGNSARRCSR